MPSFTAWWALTNIGKPKQGETLYVSAASGAVGQIVGQIGKKMGLRVVGSAGSDENVALLVDKLGYDSAFNYKTCDILEELKLSCPNGIDINFENVGGKMLDMVLTQMNNFGRIPLCGLISQYDGDVYPIKNFSPVLWKRLTIQGFIISEHWDEYSKFLEFMMEFVKDEKFHYEVTITNGLESLPDAFIGMMNGKNVGKALVKV